MSLSDIAAIASVLSSIAVLVSLIYLALQVRQAAANQRSETQSNTAARRVDLLLRMAEPGMTEIMVHGGPGDPDLDPLQALRYSLVANATVTNSEEEFFQHKNGMLDDARFAIQLGILRGQFTQPGFRVAWRMNRPMYNPEFVAFMDDIMKSAPVMTGGPAGAWKTFATEERAAAKG